MKRLKLVGTASVALLVLAVGVWVTPSALALPEINVTLTSTFPIHLEVTNLTISTQLSESGGLFAKGKGILLLYLAIDLTSLGIFELLFLNVEEKNVGLKCNTPGDKEAEELFRGTWHLVYTSLSPLTLGVLLLVPPTEIKCSIESFRLKGSMLAGVANPFSGQLESLGDVLQGNGKGEANLTGYYLDSGQTAKAKFESGTNEAAEEVTGTIVTHSLEGKMFEIEKA